MPICSRCQAELSNDNWNPSQQKKHNNKCKECTRKEMRMNWANNGKAYNQRRRERNYFPKIRETNKRYRDNLARVKQGKVCVCCGSHVLLSIDHIVPVTRGQKREGGTLRLLQYTKDPKGKQILCETCNSSKGRGTYCGVHSQYLGNWENLVQFSDWIKARQPSQAEAT